MSASKEQAAIALPEGVEILDLHLDTLIPARLVGYDPLRRHAPFLGGRFFGHADLPRLLEGGVGGAFWSITTNPFRTQRGRSRALLAGVERLRSLAAASEGRLEVAGSASAYRQARARGAHVALPAIQGGHALAPAPESARLPDPDIVRVTLVHLTSSWVGATSTPLLGRRGDLTDEGRGLVRRLDRQGVLVDVAHLHPRALRAVVEVHDPELPLVASHTGVSGVTPHWRNLDDHALEAIARTGGLVGILLQGAFLWRPGGPRDARAVVEHLEHVIAVCGEDHAAIGTDLDGMVVPPRDLRGADRLPALCRAMRDAGFSEPRIRKILGENALRVLARVRP